MTSETFSLYGRNLKCFGAEAQGFTTLKTINLIIGRNNSGKSSLLDLVHQATLPKVDVPPMHWHAGRQTEVLVETTVTEDDVLVFPANTSGGSIAGNHYEFGRQYIGAQMTVSLTQLGHYEYISLRPPAGQDRTYVDLKSTPYSSSLANRAGRNPLINKEFWRLAAERDIVQEPDSADLRLGGDGRGATNAIQHFLNKSHLPSELVEVDLLQALNAVFNPDAAFTQILCQQHVTGLWEVYLSETGKGRIALSNSGSGLKTIILALSFIHLLPRLLKKPLGEFIFAFEELENNLHPALQRRLLTYLAGQARKHGFQIFLTTHSSVAIDLFNKQQDAQIIHVRHDGKTATCRAIHAYIEHHGILDDLDIRASDLLQSNGVIWVEGPSDRIYLNRWISLWSDGQLAEGNHYQCVFYGGRLLAHLSGTAPADDGDDGGVAILRVNRNAAVLIDSDRRTAHDPLNRTKERIISEVQAFGGLAWVTDGREVENYTASTVIAKWLPDINVSDLSDTHEDFFEYLERLDPVKGKTFVHKKPLLAEQLAALTERSDLEGQPVLARRLEQLCEQVRRWNSLPLLAS